VVDEICTLTGIYGIWYLKSVEFRYSPFEYLNQLVARFYGEPIKMVKVA